MVLKLHGVDGIGVLYYVSVPLRGCGFEIMRRDSIFTHYTYSFPSPCGDVVLKYFREEEPIQEEDIVSVPLRGCGFEI